MTNPIPQLPPPSVPVEAARPAAAATEEAVNSEGFSFGDLLDMINPLQHLPGVSTVYREVSGDQLSGLPRLVGATLLGGLTGGLGAVTGAISATANLFSSEATGKDLGQHLLSFLKHPADGDNPAGPAPLASIGEESFHPDYPNGVQSASLPPPPASKDATAAAKSPAAPTPLAQPASAAEPATLATPWPSSGSWADGEPLGETIPAPTTGTGPLLAQPGRGTTPLPGEADAPLPPEPEGGGLLSPTAATPPADAPTLAKQPASPAPVVAPPARAGTLPTAAVAPGAVSSEQLAAKARYQAFSATARTSGRGGGRIDTHR